MVSLPKRILRYDEAVFVVRRMVNPILGPSLHPTYKEQALLQHGPR